MLTQITQQDFTAFLKHKRLLSYTQADVVELDNLIRKYINKHHTSCSTCGNSLREAKDTANQFLANNMAKIQELLSATEPPEPQVVEVEEIPKYQKKKRRSN